mmetsp:Transcript_9300/g.26143  ORF Transcript_9300/g.26143 Transcript_9300/m.26143 type:complete len:224 (+) Transcript_9300:36-707(+)
MWWLPCTKQPLTLRPPAGDCQGHEEKGTTLSATQRPAAAPDHPGGSACAAQCARTWGSGRGRHRAPVCPCPRAGAPAALARPWLKQAPARHCHPWWTAARAQTHGQNPPRSCTPSPRPRARLRGLRGGNCGVVARQPRAPATVHVSVPPGPPASPLRRRALGPRPASARSPGGGARPRPSAARPRPADACGRPWHWPATAYFPRAPPRGWLCAGPAHGPRAPA